MTISSLTATHEESRVEPDRAYCYSSTVEHYDMHFAVAKANQMREELKGITEDELDVMWPIHKKPAISKSRWLAFLV